jgi:ketosteroid isomerase-like protein
VSDFRAIADRAEIEALRGEAADAVMMRDYDRAASLFTPVAVVRIPHIHTEAIGREQIRAGAERLQGLLDYFVQTTHPGTIVLNGDTASGCAYIQELIRFRDGRSQLNYAIYHDRYRRTGNGWKFTERLYEIRYLDHGPLTGSPPRPAGAPADPPAGNTPAAEGASGRHPKPPSPRLGPGTADPAPPAPTTLPHRGPAQEGMRALRTPAHKGETE